MNIDKEPSRSKLVRAYRNEHDLTLMEVRKDWQGIASMRLGVLAVTENKTGVTTARIESLELTGIDPCGSILGDNHVV